MIVLVLLVMAATIVLNAYVLVTNVFKIYIACIVTIIAIVIVIEVVTVFMVGKGRSSRIHVSGCVNGVVGRVVGMVTRAEKANPSKASGMS